METVDRNDATICVSESFCLTALNKDGQAYHTAI